MSPHGLNVGVEGGFPVPPRENCALVLVVLAIVDVVAVLRVVTESADEGAQTVDQIGIGAKLFGERFSKPLVDLG
ncbi:hypothetical protein D3C80_1630160 [compost metagenome]